MKVTLPWRRRGGIKSAPTIDSYQLDSFNKEVYLELNPDVAAAGMDPIEHYLAHGIAEKRIASLPAVEGDNTFSSNLSNILVVTHEASRTGAPVLSLNISKELATKYNVVNLILGKGSIEQYFIFQKSATLIVPNLKIHPPLTRLLIGHLARSYNFKFAIVNSVESRFVLEDLSKNDVPTLSLIHEFASYTRPEDAFRRTFFWSNQVVFSAGIVKDNALSVNPDLGLRPIHILPQGKCVLPVDEATSSDIKLERDRIRNLIRPSNLDPDAVIILGAGFVQIRKGVDLFIECATRVLSSPGGEKCRFIWIGKGYDPEGDIAYSVYIKDQIERSGFKDRIIFIDETPAIEVAYEEVDLFLLSSRLDPLPNVAIEVMSHRVPVLCFDKTTGIADFLKENGLKDFCVAQYIDTTEMSQKILALVGSRELYQFVAKHCQNSAIENFDMSKYVSKLEKLGEQAVIKVEQERLDFQKILDSGLYQSTFSGYVYNIDATPQDHVRSYVRSWAAGVGRRKPFPGFHPGIYLEQHGVAIPGSDPFADYIRAGCPQGAWNNLVISSESKVDIRHLPSSKNVALHIHAYYPELLPEIIKALEFNQIRPDLFISVRDEAAAEVAGNMLQSYRGEVVDIQVVPNRGRDIGPLLTQFGKVLLEKYEFIGHLHTKKSTDVKDAQMGSVWYRFLLANLLGTHKFSMADAILSKLNVEPTIGVIFPDDPNVIGWEKNEEFAISLTKNTDIKELPSAFLFPIGTMFWAKADAIRWLIDLDLSWDDYPAEPLPYDGSILHAIERLIGLPVNNYEVATTYVAGVTR